jgi:hypothetical protein
VLPNPYMHGKEEKKPPPRQHLGEAWPRSASPDGRLLRLVEANRTAQGRPSEALYSQKSGSAYGAGASITSCAGMPPLPSHGCFCPGIVWPNST